jgi:hypothetical protein
MLLVKLGFDSFGRWNKGSISMLKSLKRSGDLIGWYGQDTESNCEIYFVPGAKNSQEAISAGMPSLAAVSGELKRPSELLPNFEILF